MDNEIKNDNLENNEELLNDILKTDHRKVVENIFDSEKDKTVVLSKNNLLRNVFIALFILLVVSVGSLFFIFSSFKKDDSTNKDVSKNQTSSNIVLNISNPSGVKEDGSIEYVIDFKNTQKYSMENVNLIARFPSEFYYVSSDLNTDSVNDKNATWKFDKILPNEDKKITIKGFVFGKVGIESVLSVNMDYRFETISANFSSSNSLNIIIPKSIIDVVFERSDVFYVGKDISYKIKIKNNSNKAINNVRLNFNYPNYLKIKDVSIKAYKEYQNESLAWIFDLNKKQEDKTDSSVDDYYEKIIEIKGVVDDVKVSEIPLKLSLGIIPDLSSSDNFDEPVYESEDVIRTSSSGLSFEFTSNPEILDVNSEKISTINPGSLYKMNFKYKKTNQALSFKDLRLVVEFIGDDILDSNISSNIKPKITSNNSNGLSNIVLEFDKSSNPSFADVSELEKELAFSINTKKDIKNTSDSYLYSNVKISLFGKNGVNKNEIELIDNKQFKIALGSGLSISQNSAFAGTLKANTKSSLVDYTLSLSNLHNNLSGVGVYFNIPEGFEYSGDYEATKAERFNYDKDTRKLMWVIGDIGQYEKNINLKISFNITPNTTQIGKNIDLLSKITIDYKDNFLNKDFNLNFDPIKSKSKIVK